MRENLFPNLILSLFLPQFAGKPFPENLNGIIFPILPVKHVQEPVRRLFSVRCASHPTALPASAPDSQPLLPFQTL